MAYSFKGKVTALDLVYPPISSQEAVWAQRDVDVERVIRMSDFYMIGGRAEARFANFSTDGGRLLFEFVVGTNFSDPVSIDVSNLPAVSEADCEGLVLELGDKLIRIWDRDLDDPQAELLEWFTTEKLIWNRSGGMEGIDAFDRYREVATYDLLYVGIATGQDTFDRLVRNGHRARQEILSNEPQRSPNARVADEIYLFAFRVDPLFIQVFGEEQLPNWTQDIGRLSIVADAEKAFVALLHPQYNKVRFKQYPRGADGLYGAGYDRYCYSIRENITFRTSNNYFRGGRNTTTGMIANDADMIMVDGDDVMLIEGIELGGT